MLTVKLCQGDSMVIIEAPEVRVAPGQDGGKVIAVGTDHYRVDGKEYDVAYVENARGSTLQVVKP